MIRLRPSCIQFVITIVLLLTIAGTAYAAPTVIFFNTTGTTSWTVPAGVTAVDYLVVAGGGGGGFYGGGGGAGGFTAGTFTSVSGSVTVTVGAGGAGSTSSNLRGNNGSNSVFASITAIGGGGGGSSGATSACSGASGGSGGGGARSGYAGGSGTSGQGYAGGAGYTYQAGRYNGGGGGGASEAGTASTSRFVGGDGGDGLYSDISGVNTPYAGGGGGGGRGAAGSGGIGGGGNGAIGGTPGSNGQPNTGGGGGGGGRIGRGGNGGSGIVIIRYILPEVTNITPSSGPLEGGTNVTITGSGFTGVTAVRFGSTLATSYTFMNDTTILATSPPNATAGTVDVTITTPYGTSTAVAGDKFTYSLPQLEIDVNGTISNWALEIGENTDTTNLTLKVISSGSWGVSVYDALDLGKPAGTAGHMAEHDGSSYTLPVTYLSSPVQMTYTGGPPLFNLSGGQQTLVSGTATPPAGTVFPLVVNQTIDYGDVSLTPPSFYQIIVTFVGTST